MSSVGSPCLCASYRDIVIYSDFEAHELTYAQWKSVLHLSTRWGFATLRKLALKSIQPPTPHDQLILARTYSVEHWVLPALTALCSRTLPLCLNEAQQMSMEDVILVATVREEIRGSALRVDVADIPRHMAKVEAKAQRSQQAKIEAEMKAMTDTEAHAKESMAPKAKIEAKAELQAETEASEATNLKAERESLALAKVEAELRDEADAEAKEKWGADTKAKAEADAKVADEAKVKATEASTERAELEATKKAEKERLEIEAKFKAEAAKAEENRKRIEVEKAELRAKRAEE